MESVPHTPFMIVIRSARRKLLRGSALAWRAHGPTGRGKSGRGHRGTGGGPAASPAPACVAGGASGGEFRGVCSRECKHKPHCIQDVTCPHLHSHPYVTIASIGVYDFRAKQNKQIHIPHHRRHVCLPGRADTASAASARTAIPPPHSTRARSPQDRSSHQGRHHKYRPRTRSAGRSAER